MTAIGLISRAVLNNYATATEKQVFNGQYTSYSVIVTLSVALSFYNTLEMTLLIASTFKKWKGLYCWSLIICNTGVFLYTLGMMLSYFELCVEWLWKVILDIGWVTMVGFQSLVLYSRLGLIVHNSHILAAVKWMIIIANVLVLPTVVVLDFGNVYSGLPGFWEGYYYIEHIQVTWFTIQELIISGLYVWKTSGMLRDILQQNTRSMIWQLFIINIIMVAMDLAIVTFQYLHLQLYQEATKAFFYSVKLKLELNILSKLVNLVHDNKTTRSMTLDAIDSNAIQGQAQSDVHREISLPTNVMNWLGNGEKKGALDTVEKRVPSPKGSNSSQPPDDSDEVSRGTTSQPADENNEISRVLSNQSRYTARTSGRESDIMYADMLRSI